MADALEELVDSLLYEGYALYPYTPGATKNATPTPFGIVYPPAYAEMLASTFDHLELRCVLEAPSDAVLSAEVRFLASGGARHEAKARAVPLSGAMVGALAAAPARKQARVGAERSPPLEVGLALSTAPVAEGIYEVCLRVENRTVVRSGLDRAGALARSLISTHPSCASAAGGSSRRSSGRARASTPSRCSPPRPTTSCSARRSCCPTIPRSRRRAVGRLFDGTEIEEALLLHVQALSDGEREQIEQQDPAVREMIERAAAATPEDIVRSTAG